jgi:aminobenzoyl-glutamate utilization protein B
MRNSLMPALVMGLLANFGWNSSARAQADTGPQEKEVLAAVDKMVPTIEEIAQKLWDLSEVSLLELKSSTYLKDLLEKNGFTITSEKTASVPTAFIAEYGC